MSRTPSLAPQSPQLTRKRSIRDHLRVWKRSTPQMALEVVEEETTKPRLPYVPKHAAADFARLPVPAAGATESGGYRRHSLPQRQIIDEPQELSHWHSQFSATMPTKRYFYTLGDNPFQASQRAVHGPVDPTPITRSPLGESPSLEPEQQQQSDHELTDYELFIMHAQAEEQRRHSERERMSLNNLVKRSAEASSTSRVLPDPHKQYASVMGKASMTDSGMASGARHSEGPSKKHNHMDRKEPRKVQGLLEGNVELPGRKNTCVKDSVEGSKSLQKQYRQSLSQGSSLLAGERQPGHGLHRRSSLKKRIADYIRPPRVESGVGSVVE